MKDFNALHFVDLSDSTFAIIALYGFTYNKKIFSSKLWKIVFIISAISEITCGCIEVLNKFSFFKLMIYLAFGCFFVVPLYYAFYQYAFRKNDIWYIKN